MGEDLIDTLSRVRTKNKGGIEEENMAVMRAKTHSCLDHSVTPEPGMKEKTSVEINQRINGGKSSKHVFSVVATTAIVDCWRLLKTFSG